MTNQTTHEIPKTRRYFMSGLFALNFLSLFVDNWTTILFPSEQLGTLEGVAISFWAAFSLLMLIGIRYPTKMIPLLMLQLLYKASWIIGVYRPAYFNGEVTEGLQSFLWVCVAGVVLNLLIIPWKYVFREYVTFSVASLTK